MVGLEAVQSCAVEVLLPPARGFELLWNDMLAEAEPEPLDGRESASYLGARGRRWSRSPSRSPVPLVTSRRCPARRPRKNGLGNVPGELPRDREPSGRWLPRPKSRP